MGIITHWLQEIFKPEIELIVPQNNTLIPTSNDTSSSGMICGVDGCNNKASFKIRYMSNDGRVEIEEYRCNNHRNVKKRDMRENKMAITTGKNLSDVRKKTRGKNWDKK